MVPGTAVVAVVGVVAAMSALGGCGGVTATPRPSGSHLLVLIQGSRSRAVDARIASGARAQATRLGFRLTVTTPATSTAATQISIIDAVTASKPAGVLIERDGGQALAAPVQSMRSAGIEVVEVDLGGHRAPQSARQEGITAVRHAVEALHGED
jgi:ribose transport system substrate-binding protein